MDEKSDSYVAEKFLRIVAELDRMLAVGNAEAFWAVRPVFAEMDKSFLSGWAASRLTEILNNKDPLVFRDRDALTINVTKTYAISLAMIVKPPKALFLYPQHYMARNVGRGPIKLRRYHPDRPIAADVYDPGVRLVLHEELELAPGETVERDGLRDVLDWEASDGTGFLLRLHSASIGGYEWAFDRETLAPIGVTVLDSYSSQITTAMQMLTALGAPVDDTFVEAGLTSPYFHVRWEAAKMVGQLAPERARETLERLRHDPHPSIRNAVEKTMMTASERH